MKTLVSCFCVLFCSFFSSFHFGHQFPLPSFSHTTGKKILKREREKHLCFCCALKHHTVIKLLFVFIIGNLMKTRDMSDSISVVRPLNLPYHGGRNGLFDCLVPTSQASLKITTTVTSAYQIHRFQSPKGPVLWVKCCPVTPTAECCIHHVVKDFGSSCQIVTQ